MSYYTCDACHYIFQADEKPVYCPSCCNKSITVRNGNGRQFRLAAVRPSTEYEIEQSMLTDAQQKRKQGIRERVKGLSGYKLSDNEYNTALMLIFYLASVPAEYTREHLGNLLNQRNSFLEEKMAETVSRDLYSSIQKHFRTSLADERRKVGSNDAVTVASYAGEGSAASLLIQFRQDLKDQIIGKTPNLTDIRNVRFDEVVKEPGDGYIRFLTDWYNSID